MWCSHAGPRLLTINVSRKLLHKMASGSGRAYQELLRKHAAQVGNLTLDLWEPPASDLLDLRMPSLQRLTIKQFKGSPVCIRSENMPMLRDLRLRTRATPEIPAPLTNLTHLHYTTNAHILQRDVVQIFPKLPQLQHLSLELLNKNASRIQASTGPRSVVQSLISLEVRCDCSSLLSRCLDLWSLPNLQTIVLYGEDEREEWTPLFQSLV